MRNNFKTLAFIIFFIFVIGFNNSFSQLSGTYSIGTGGNYITITSAVNALVTNGVSGSVIFNIITGTYNESVVLDFVLGTNPLKSVTFRSLTGNPDDVIWKSSDSVTVEIDKADYLNFQNITFTGGEVPSNFIIIRLDGVIDNLVFNNNKFICVAPNPCSAIYGNNFISNSLLIKNDSFVNFLNGINLIDDLNKSQNCKIENNTITGCGYGIILTNLNSSTIYKNIITGFGNAIILNSCDDSLTILKNKISGGGGRAILINTCFGNNSLIANNFVNSSIEGIANWNSHDQNFYFNTVYGGLFAFTMVGGVGNSFYNNILYGDFVAYQADAPGVVSDYNDFYSGGPFIANYNSSNVNLDSLKTLSGNDHHSISRIVNFVSPPADLHLNNLSIGDESLAGIPIFQVTDDIDGETRRSPYMGADEADIVLPVFLELFTASVERRNVTLKWMTIYESNNSGFDIERSQDGKSEWKKIGFVQGNGSTTAPHSYIFDDNELITGKYIYRLKQIDFNGNFNYLYLAREIVIGIINKFELSQNYPNPFNPTTSIDFNLPVDEKVIIKIFDIKGQEMKTLVNEFKNAGYYTLNFNGEHLASGIYFYTIETKDFKDTKRMILLK